MQVGAIVWKDNEPAIVLADDGEGSVTVGYFPTWETIKVEAEQPNPFATSEVVAEGKPETADPNAKS